MKMIPMKKLIPALAFVSVLSCSSFAGAQTTSPKCAADKQAATKIITDLQTTLNRLIAMTKYYEKMNLATLQTTTEATSTALKWEVNNLNAFVEKNFTNCH